MLVLLIIFVVHFLADFVFQSSKMATGKSKSLKWLSVHVTVYGLVSILSLLVIYFAFKQIEMAIYWWMLNVILHFFVDFVTSKITSVFWEQKNMRLFFVMIGLDQLIHILCLTGTYFLLLHRYFSNIVIY